MGTVYKAEDQWMGRVVAIKVVAAHLTTKDRAVARFRREVQAAARLTHQNIIRAYDTGEAGGCQFLVMEFVEGVSLDKLVAKKGPLPVALACVLIRQAALGLQHAAEQGMVHRDIKPQNLMVTRKGQLKILDFGLARFASLDDDPPAPGRVPFGAWAAVAGSAMTNPNLVMGTPDYLSPEQAKNSHEVDPRSDIYSLGCTLYFLLTGKPPFHDATTLIDKLLAHTHSEPVSVRQLRPDVPAALESVLATMMAKNPARRYAKASEVAAALTPFTRSDTGLEPGTEPEPVFEVAEAAVASRSQRLSGSPTPPAPGLATPTETDAQRAEATFRDLAPPRRKKKSARKAELWWKRRRGWLISGFALVVLLLVGMVMAASHSQKPQENATSAKTAPTNPPGSEPNPPSRSVEPALKGGRSAPTPVPPIVIAPPARDEVVILYVVPSSGVTIADVVDVRERLTRDREGKKLIRMEIAATTGTRSFSVGGHESLPIDVHLTEGMKLEKYAAVVFSGFHVDEYTAPTGSGRRAAYHVIREMYRAQKPIAAICAGQAVLAGNGILKDRKAAIPTRVFDHSQFKRYFSDPTIRWQKLPVVMDDTSGPPIITAAGAVHADLLAQALLRVIDSR
jgi:serine/threonine-protein kinase